MWYSFIFYFSYDKILLKYFRYISKKIIDKERCKYGFKKMPKMWGISFIKY